MLAKKESFLKFLRDESPPKKIVENNSIQLEKQNNNNEDNNNNQGNNILNNKNDNETDNNKKIDDYSFENFINHVKGYDYNKKIKWDSQVHKESMANDKNMYKIILMELFRNNYANPLLLINQDYLKSNYQNHLFEQEINHIEDKIKINQYNKKIKNKKDKSNNNIILENPNLFVENIIEEREKYELNKKVINYYLTYFCQNNYEKLAPSLLIMQQISKDINICCDKIHNGKNKIQKLKKYNLENTIKLILKKKKRENLFKLNSLLKDTILTIYKDVKTLKLKSMNFDYINYYKENNKIINNIEKIENNLEIVFKTSENKKLKIFNEIKKKVMKKKEKFNYKYLAEINNLFDSKKSNILQLYYLYNIENSIKSNDDITDNKINNQSNLFMTKMIKNFKLKSKKLILETVHFYKKKEKQRSNSITMLNLNNQKLSDINNIHFEENDLIICFKNILSKLKNHSDIFLYYYNLICSNDIDSNEYKYLIKEMKSRKNEFYEILDKHLSKLVKLFYNSKDRQNEEKVISKKNFLIILNLICLFSKLLKFKFDVDYSKYLNLALKNYIVNQIKFENRSNLSRAITLLPNDIWDITFLDSSFFQINSIKEKTPFYLKKFITFLNEDEIEENTISKEINKNNIEDIFNYINNTDNIKDNNNSNNNENINFDDVVDLYNNKKGIKLLNKKNNIIILNKPLKYNSLYVTNSSCCILKGIEEQIINLIMFDYLTYEIFSYLFNSVDLYIFICFKIFLTDNKYLSSLLRPLNLKEIQKDIENIEYWSEVTSYQQKYSELKKFYISSEKKFCEFYGHSKKFNSDEEKQNYIENLIPKLNENILNMDMIENEINHQNNKYSNNNNKMNFNINIFKNKNKNKNGIQKNNDSNNNNYYINKNDDSIETLNINQINENNKKNISDEKKNEKDKNKDLSFFEKLRSAVDDIGDGLTKAKDTAKNILKESQVLDSVIIKDIQDKIISTHLKQIIILISTISTLHKTLKRLEGFTSKIELDFQKNQIIEKFNKYKKLKDQMQYFFFMKISVNLFDFSKISAIIEDFNWSPSAEDGSSQLFEASSWVNKIIKLFEIIVNEIIIQFNEIFGEKKLTQYIIILIKFIISNIQETFAKIKSCNDTGRSVMLKDIKFLKQGIENVLKKNNFNKKIKTEELFDVIFQYVNAWYYNSEELIKFIFDNNIQYKYFESFLNNSPTINDLSVENKKSFINRVKQKYLIQFKKVIVSLKD